MIYRSMSRTRDDLHGSREPYPNYIYHVSDTCVQLPASRHAIERYERILIG